MGVMGRMGRVRRAGRVIWVRKVIGGVWGVILPCLVIYNTVWVVLIHLHHYPTCIAGPPPEIFEDTLPAAVTRGGTVA